MLQHRYINGCISEIYSRIRTKHASQSHLLLLEWALTFLLQCKRDVHFNCKHESGICVCCLIAARNKIVHGALCGKCIRLRIMLSKYNFGLKIAHFVQCITKCQVGLEKRSIITHMLRQPVLRNTQYLLVRTKIIQNPTVTK
ncbi:Hypothetical_protein [Hexamita inflata]|uniref:Hypothetical_protein n=1 Tax=Hexamita inflata TaxID=28002 RepID=A0AA86PCU4_9EUKA|nr:Hypothetical protein HINF_LOCUS24304 [Hexamita inflata]